MGNHQINLGVKQFLISIKMRIEQSFSVASQSLSFDAGRGSSSTKMSSSQVTVTNGYPNQMAPTMYNAGASINPMQMNGIYQMNSLVPPGQASQAWQMNAPQTPTEFHPMYQQQQAQMQQVGI